MLDITKFHGQNAPKEELETVEILPLGFYDAGTYTIPENYTWSDFEKVVFKSTAASEGYIRDEVTLDAQELQSFGDGEQMLTLNAPFGSGITNINVNRVSATQFSLGGVENFGQIRSITGERKRYATKNLSRTISVNLGNNIAVNSRYEVDLPSEFYETDGSIKKGVNVRAEIYNDGSAGGEIGWGRAPIDMRFNSSTSGYFSGGVDAEILEDKVVVFSGENALAWQNANRPTVFNNTSNISAAPCQVVATLNDAYILSVEPAQGSFERIVNAGLDVLEFTNNGDYAYVPLSDTDFDGDIFEYNSTTRFLRPKKSGKHIPSVFSHAEDGAGQARVKYVLVQADTAQGDNPVVATGVFTKQYTSDGGTQSIHTPINLDESKWYALYAENFTAGNVTYTSLVSPTSEPDLGDITDYAFIFSLERG